MTKEDGSPTYYQILGIPKSATQAEVKAAYRHVLLSSHPDKRTSPSSSKDAKEFNVARIQDAYHTLADVDSRAAYDASLARSQLSIGTRVVSSGPRPAQVVSLEDFTFMESDNSAVMTWSYACRCGGMYSITEKDMEQDRHLSACDQCSEVIYVGYEVVEENGNVE